MVRRSLTALICTAGWLCQAKAWADVYVYTDPQGVVHYTNAPDHENYNRIIALLVEEIGETNRAEAKPEVTSVVQFAQIIEGAAEEAGLEPALVHAVITVESAYNAKAQSRAGAQGLMQLMPATARRYQVKDSFDPEDNIRGGIRYLRDLMAMFGSNIELVLAAYNAGENAVKKHGWRIPPYAETKAYVPKVLRVYEKIKRSSRSGK